MAFEVDYFILSGADATITKAVTLSGTPSSSAVAMDLIGGTAQAISGDFGVSGNQIKWDGTYALNGVLAKDDKVRVIYDRA